MTAKEAVERISELLNLKFGSSHKFATTKLEDGTEVTNNLDEEFKIGQELYVVGESTLTPAPAGTHTTREGLKLTVDAESIIIAMEEKTTEAPADEEGKPESEVKDESMSEVEVEVPTEAADVMTEDVVQAVVEALIPIVEEVKTLTEEMRKMKEMYESSYSSLKEDFTAFKKQPQRFSVTEVKKSFKESAEDYKLNVIKAFKK
jgi:hypothetical protein